MVFKTLFLILISWFSFSPSASAARAMSAADDAIYRLLSIEYTPSREASLLNTLNVQTTRSYFNRDFLQRRIQGLPEVRRGGLRTGTAREFAKRGLHQSWVKIIDDIGLSEEKMKAALDTWDSTVKAQYDKTVRQFELGRVEDAIKENRQLTAAQERFFEEVMEIKEGHKIRFVSKGEREVTPFSTQVQGILDSLRKEVAAQKREIKRLFNE